MKIIFRVMMAFFCLVAGVSFCTELVGTFCGHALGIWDIRFALMLSAMTAVNYFLGGVIELLRAKP